MKPIWIFALAVLIAALVTWNDWGPQFMAWLDR